MLYFTLSAGKLAIDGDNIFKIFTLMITNAPGLRLRLHPGYKYPHRSLDAAKRNPGLSLLHLHTFFYP